MKKLLPILIAFMIVGCSTDYNKQIVGKWEAKEGAKIEFTADGAIIEHLKDGRISKSQYTLHYPELDISSTTGTSRCWCTIEGDKLTISHGSDLRPKDHKFGPTIIYYRK